jgi:hypothetical protein
MKRSFSFVQISGIVYTWKEQVSLPAAALEAALVKLLDPYHDWGRHPRATWWYERQLRGHALSRCCAKKKLFGRGGEDEKVQAPLPS